MTKFYSLFLVIIVIFTVTCYIGTSSIISSMIVAIFSFIYFFFIAAKRIRKYLKSSSRFHSCYTFINSFIVSLSIKGSLLSAFESVRINMDKEYLSLYEGITTMHDERKLKYLKDYFSFDVYQVFLAVVSIFIEQGGDIFELSHYLTSELRRKEDYLVKCETITRRKVVDFAVLWIFTLVIIVILKYSLNEFYGLITNLFFYQAAIVGLYLLVLVSVHFLIIRSTKVEIRGFNDVK